ncbi:MAG: VOC family protein [Chitinophagaceae bacterium]|nr:VOC family protein [Chitinophagaceae bacterium]
MNNKNNLPEFRFYYFTNNYEETVAFYRDRLQLEVNHSWDRGELDKGAIFWSPNRTGLIEIEKGTEAPVLGGALYIEVEDVEEWYKKIVNKEIKIIQPLTDMFYGHRSFKFEDPNKLVIGLFKYLR